MVNDVGIARYRNFIIYCFFSLIASLLVSYAKCQWPWPRLLSFAGAIDIFWLFLAVYFIVWGKDVRIRWDQNVKPIVFANLRTILGLFIAIDLVFILPEYSIGPLATFSPLVYLRTLLFVSLFIGFSSVVTFSLGWATSIKITPGKRGDFVRVLSNLVTAISFFGVIMAIFSHFAPSDIWVQRIPKSFPQEGLIGLFSQYASTLFYFSSLCTSIGFVTTGILMRLVSNGNGLITFFLGLLFCLSIGLVIGYAVGPLIFFAVTEVAFISGAMIGIGLITCMLSST